MKRSRTLPANYTNLQLHKNNHQPEGLCDNFLWIGIAYSLWYVIQFLSVLGRLTRFLGKSKANSYVFWYILTNIPNIRTQYLRIETSRRKEYWREELNFHSRHDSHGIYQMAWHYQEVWVLFFHTLMHVHHHQDNGEFVNWITYRIVNPFVSPAYAFV